GQLVRCRLTEQRTHAFALSEFARLDRHCVECGAKSGERRALRALHAQRSTLYAMTHPIQTTIDFQDSEPFRFECASCGTLHEGIRSFGWDYPAQYLALPDGQRTQRAVLSDDTCVIDNEWFFIRGCLEIRVNGYHEPLNYGVWLSLSRESFARYST